MTRHAAPHARCRTGSTPRAPALRPDPRRRVAAALDLDGGVIIRLDDTGHLPFPPVTEKTVLGIGVCGTEYGKQLGAGLFEFRLRGRDLAKIVPAAEPGEEAEAKMLLRVFCHAYGERIVLLLAGYDKARTPRPSGRPRRSRSPASG